MKKKIIIAFLLLTSVLTFAQTNKAGKIYVSDNKNEIGKAYTLGSDKSVNIVLDGPDPNKTKFLSLDLIAKRIFFPFCREKWQI